MLLQPIVTAYNEQDGVTAAIRRASLVRGKLARFGIHLEESETDREPVPTFSGS